MKYLTKFNNKNGLMMLIAFKRNQFFLIFLLCLSPGAGWSFDYLQPLPESAPVPSDNPQTMAKISLGRQLFFDPILLGPDSKLSCNSCHTLAKGGSDNRAQSFGQNGKLTQRSSPGLWNIGFQTVLYWDGRSTSLENQLLDHLRDPVISGWKNIGTIIDQLKKSAEYRREFKKVFNVAKYEEDTISGVNLARAIASFERSLITEKSPFDLYISGNKSAISASAKRGLSLFNNVGCLACHFGAGFSGPAPGPALKMGDGFYELFPNNLGTTYEQKYRLSEDLGRYEFTGIPDERYMWRVPTLRNIELTGPYFHNGSVSTLSEAIRVMAKTQLGKKLPETAVKDIEEFLKSLTADLPAKF